MYPSIAWVTAIMTKTAMTKTLEEGEPPSPKTPDRSSRRGTHIPATSGNQFQRGCGFLINIRIPNMKRLKCRTSNPPIQTAK
jgi:hypothetical protein